MRFVAPAWALLMGCGILWAARLIYAETIARQATVEAFQHAAELDRFAPPAVYFENLGEIDPDRAVEWRDAALRANPRLTAAWIGNGLDAERRGAMREAEADLLQAAAVDRRYLPAWTLTNFYFRQNRRAEFWLWAARAARLTYDDFRPLLALAHAVEPDPQTVAAKLGDAQQVIEADVDYLAGQGRLGDAQQAARLLLARRFGGEGGRILELTDRQIRAGRAGDAVELWNSLRPAAEAPLDPRSDASADSDFETAPSGVAFAWRLHPAQGLASAWKAGELTLVLSGDQPESCVLLDQIVPVEPTLRYRMHYEYTTSGLAGATGLAWDFDGATRIAIPPAATWQSGEAIVATSRSQPVRVKSAGAKAGAAPTAPVLGTIRLLYSREIGTTRAHGQIRLRRVRLEAL